MSCAVTLLAAGVGHLAGAVVPGELPALPLHTAGKYVAAAYVVVFALVLVYVAIMALRLSRIERALSELLAQGGPSDAQDSPPAAQERANPRMESTVQ